MSGTPSDSWKTIKQWPELILDRIEDAGVARITLNRPDKRNCWNRALCNAFLECNVGHGSARAERTGIMLD